MATSPAKAGFPTAHLPREAKATAPQDSFITMGIKTNAFGKFSFGIPKAGWWGFCALGVGPVKEYKGKELSQDAVIWVNAQDMKEHQ